MISAFFDLKMIWYKYISFKKVVNLFKMYLSYLLSILTRKAIVWGYPFSITTEPTNKCNLKCLECPTGNNSANRKKGFQDIKLYKKLIDDIKDFTIYHMVYFQGEPFLHQDLYEFIKYANQNKIYTSISTNGHFLNKENCKRVIHSGLKKIIISIDGTDQETYEKYRLGGNFNKVISGIKNLVLVKKELKSIYPKIHLQFLVLKHNQYQLAEIKRLSKVLGVNKLKLKSAQIENFTQNSDLIPNISKYSRYFKKSHYQTKTKLPDKCFRIWSTAVISWEGILIPCCFDKNLEFNLGNINKNSMLKLWKHNIFNNFRKTILHNRKKVAICRNCSEGLRIRY